MSRINRPNDVWLRIWLIVTWLVFGIINAQIIFPLLPPRTGILSWFEVEIVLFSLVLTFILIVMWKKLRHPSCACWDDIRVKKRVKQQPIPENIDCMNEVEES